MTPVLQSQAEELVRFKEPASASVIVPFAGRRRKRLSNSAQKTGYLSSTRFSNVAFIVAHSPDFQNAQAWFWAAAWQQGEAQATAEAAAGLGRVFDNAEDFLASLDD